MTTPFRLWRSPLTAGEPYLLRLPGQPATPVASQYPDSLLAAVARHGYTALCVPAVLRDLVRSAALPLFGAEREWYLASLRELIERAATQGLKVVLYLQPPHGFHQDDPLLAAVPEISGTSREVRLPDGTSLPMVAMCTSVEPVQRFLREGVAEMVSALPGLGGILLASFGEAPSHCYASRAAGQSGDQEIDCPRCRQRQPEAVIAELFALLQTGIREADPQLPIICWSRDMERIDDLPDDVLVMADFEGDSPSLAASGPSEAFRATVERCRQRGLGVVAHLAIATSPELPTVPNLALIGNLYDKVAALQELGVAQVMGTWTGAAAFCANTSAFLRFLEMEELPPRHYALGAFAREYFPGCDPASVVAGWTVFAQALQLLPTDDGFQRYGPLAGELLPCCLDPQCHQSPLDSQEAADIEASLGDLSLSEMIARLQQLRRLWSVGLRRLAEATICVSCQTGELERAAARCADHLFAHAILVYRLYELRRRWPDEQPATRELLGEVERNLGGLLPVLQQDERLGRHPGSGRLCFSAESVAELRGQLRGELA